MRTRPNASQLTGRIAALGGVIIALGLLVSAPGFASGHLVTSGAPATPAPGSVRGWMQSAMDWLVDEPEIDRGPNLLIDGPGRVMPPSSGRRFTIEQWRAVRGESWTYQRPWFPELNRMNRDEAAALGLVEPGGG